ncbi:MAG: hypothetical protein EB084_20215, partial [Proteobacteria bacterium]|nr:hypothetical protein [Pseudomonadota bacterium]
MPLVPNTPLRRTAVLLLSLAALSGAIWLRASAQPAYAGLETRAQQGFVLFEDAPAPLRALASSSATLWMRFARDWMLPEALFIVALA